MSDTVTAEIKTPLRPLDKEGLDNLVVGAKENPTEVKTLALVNRGMIGKKAISKFEGFFLSDKELEHPKI